MFHGHPLPEADNVININCTTVYQSPAWQTSPKSLLLGKLCLVKSQGWERSETHNAQTRPEMLTARAGGGVWVWKCPCSYQIQLFPSLSVTSGLEETPQRCDCFAQKLKYHHVEIRPPSPGKNVLGLQLLRVRSCLEDGYPTPYIDLWVAECTGVQCPFAC